MSNRSLLEINQDRWPAIHNDPQGFADAISGYLNSASPEHVLALERFGIRVFGMRHHSNGFTINWGGAKHSEAKS